LGGLWSKGDRYDIETAGIFMLKGERVGCVPWKGLEGTEGVEKTH